MNNPENYQPTFWGAPINMDELMQDTEMYISKIFDQGRFSDIINIINYLGEENVENVLKTASKLSHTTILVARDMFNLRLDEFKSYRDKKNKS